VVEVLGVATDDVNFSTVCHRPSMFRGCDQIHKGRGGILVDYLSRLSCRYQKDRLLLERLSILLGPRVIANINSGWLSAYKGHVDAVAIVARERLLSELREDVTVFWKSLDDPEWTWAGFGSEIYTQGRRIISEAKRHLTLKAEVEWLFIRRWAVQHSKLLAASRPREVPETRASRLQEFWTQFRAHSRPASPAAPPRAAWGRPGGARGPGREAEPVGGGEDSDELAEGHYGPDAAAASPARGQAREAFVGREVAKASVAKCSSSSMLDALRRDSGSSDFRPSSSEMWKARPTRSNCSFRKGERAPKLCLESEELPPHPRRDSIATDCSSPARTCPPARSSRLGSRPCGAPAEEAPPGPGRRRPREQQPKLVGKWWSKGRHLSALTTPSHVRVKLSDSLPSLTAGCGGSRGGRRPARPKVEPLATQGKAAPVEAQFFNEPWSSKAALKKSSAPTAIEYLEFCHKEKTLPNILPFMTGHSQDVVSSGLGLTDSDLNGLTQMISSGIEIEKVDMSGSASVTDKALRPFVECLASSPMAQPLKTLNLARCKNAGPETMASVVALLEGRPPALAAAPPPLRYLNLNGIQLALKVHVPLCLAIRKHGTLQRVHLADTGLGAAGGGTDVSKRCVADLFGSKTVSEFDLGWNCFSPEVFAQIGLCVKESQVVNSLSLASCSASAGAFDERSPINCFIEHLIWDRTLTYLDIKMNRIDYRSALIIEDALEHNGRLRELDTTHNPLGTFGMRRLLRTLASERSALVHFSCADCHNGDVPSTTEEFSSTNPNGRYQLNLARPYDRSVLRMLYKTSDDFGLPREAAMSIVSSTPAYSHPRQDDFGIYLVPDRGRVTLVFSTDRIREGTMGDVGEFDFATAMKHMNRILRMDLNFTKAVSVFAMWKHFAGRAQEQQNMLKSLSKDFNISYAQLRIMCERPTADVAPEIVAQLFNCLDEATQYRACLLMPTLGECAWVLKTTYHLHTFNIEQPTGHYKLDLENPSSFAVAERLFLLDSWERGITRSRGRVDASQLGNRSQIRNTKYAGRQLSVTSVAEWHLPQIYELVFDYVTSRRPSPGAPVLQEVSFNNILKALATSDCEEAEQVAALRMLSHRIYLRSTQLRDMLNQFRSLAVRSDVFVLLFFSIVDMYNEKVARSGLEDQQQVLKVQGRLGFATFFPHIQPEQFDFELDLKQHDQRLAAHILVEFAMKERRENVCNFSLTNEDGTLEPLLQGIPLSWEHFDKIPHSGVFRGSYICSPEDRCMAYRRRVFESHGYWSGSFADSDLLWWSSLKGTPEDVLQFITWLAGNYNNLGEPFRKMDGADGNGALTFNEFSEGISGLGFRKFKGPNEKDRIRAVFRYLDPNHEGTISESEWGILDLIWQEVHLSIREFVRFLERTIGEDLDLAWTFFDQDGSGDIDVNEWMTACQKLGYFGCVDNIFQVLDKDAGGAISYHEFKGLQGFAS